jgi:uncharacterized protein
MRIVLMTVMFVAIAAPLSAQDFGKGWAAYESGDYATAFNEWKPLAQQGDASAQYNLGFMYDNGQGVPQDYREAVKWYRLAAEQVNSSAQTNLGWMYENGRGVPQDNILAHMWYSLGAVNGNELGGDNRDVLAESMSFWEVLQAKGLFNKCINTNYSDCGY